MTCLRIQITRYGVLGLANSLVTYVFFWWLISLLGVTYLLSLVLTWCFSVVCSYVANFVWVFSPELRLKFVSYFPKHCISSVFLLLLNMAALQWAVERMRLDPLAVQIVLIPLLAGLNFASLKFWVMRKSCV